MASFISVDRKQSAYTVTPSFPETTSKLTQKLCEKVANYLVVARQKTADPDFLSALSTYRQCYIDEWGAKEIFINTVDGSAINGLHFAGTMKKAIIYLHGNGCFYETSLPKPLGWIQSLKSLSSNGEEQIPHLIVFNPRGTGKSEGVTHPDAVARDWLAIFQYLVNEHLVDSNHIALVGHSMGGFFGAFGAELIQSAFPDATIHFLSDRSFSNIHDRADLRMDRERSSYISICAIHRSIQWTRWDKDPVSALGTLKGRVCILYHPQDEVVPYPTSTHAAVEKTPKKATYSCLSLETDKNPSSAHMRDFSDSEYVFVLNELKIMLQIP